MPEAWIETIPQFAWEGRLGGMTLCLLGVGSALILAFFAWRESRLVSKPARVWMLFGLRLATLTILLLALAEPTDILTQRQHQPRTVGVFLDASASMGLVDPGDGSGDRQRWNEALGDDASPRKILDEAHGALAAAARQVTTSPEATRDALAQATSHLESGCGGLSGHERVTELEGLLSSMNASLLPSVENLPLAAVKTATEKEQIRAVQQELTTTADALRRWIDEDYERAETAATSKQTASRLSKAIAWLEQAEADWLQTMGSTVQLERYAFDRDAYAIGRRGWNGIGSEQIDPHQGTDQSAWIREIAKRRAERHLDAAIVLTDGVHNTGESPRDLAQGIQQVATALVPLGDTRLRRDVFLHHVKAPTSVMRKDTLVIEAIVSAHACEGEKLIVDLQTADGETLDQETFTITQRMEDHRVALRWKAMEIGAHALRLRVRAVPDEFTEANNEDTLKVQVIDDELRILLADRLPRWEFRYLKSILARDPRVRSHPVLFHPNHTYSGRQGEISVAPSLPETLDEWNRFRVAVLGDLSTRELPVETQENLRQWVVEAGGNLVLIAGDSMPSQFLQAPLAELLPVESRRAPISQGGYGLSVTIEGATSPPVLVADDDIQSATVWESVSRKLPVYDLSPHAIAKPTARVLIEAHALEKAAPSLAFLSWHYVGKGRVIYLSAPVAYQLRYRKGDEYHYRFWGQLFRWAMARDLAGGSRTVRLHTDKTRYPFGSEVSVRLQMSELNGLPCSQADPQLMVHADGELVQTVSFRAESGTPGSYQATLTDLPSGKIRLQASGRELDRLLLEERFEEAITHECIIDPHDSAELRVPLADTALLSNLADASGGVVTSPSSVRAFLENLDLSPITSETVSREPLWNRWWVLCLLLALLLTEWVGRKLLGLV